MKKTKLDIVAGIPSFNNQDTIANVAEQVGKSIKKYYPDKKSIICDCDGGSTDKTVENFFRSKTRVMKKVLIPNRLGKGNVLRPLFRLAVDSKAKVGLTNDSDLRSINPEWVRLQIDSIYKKGYDLCVPNYLRYKYDGQITNHICYPLIYGLFCKDIRQPIGGDFSFSAKLARQWLSAKWPVNANLFGIDIFMTSQAILNNAKICQLNLGVKIHNAKDPALTLSPMFRQVLSTLFKTIIANKGKLKEFNKIGKVKTLGKIKIKKPEPVEIDMKNMKKRIAFGYTEQKPIIKKCLHKEDFEKLRGNILYDRIHIDEEWWAKITYDYILAFKKYENKSSTILKSFLPLWFARIFTFINDTVQMDNKKAESVIKKQAQEFFKQRDYLFDKL